MIFSQTTATFVGALLFVVLIVVDVWGALDTSRGNTVSEWLRVISRYTAVVPWALGVLHGHWFHPVDRLDPLFGSASVWVLIGLSVAIVVGQALLRNFRTLWQPWIWAIAGAVAGSLLWPVWLAT